MAQQKYEAQNGCVYERTHGGALRSVVTSFKGAFGCPERQRKAEIACAALNAAEAA